MRFFFFVVLICVSSLSAAAGDVVTSAGHVAQVPEKCTSRFKVGVNDFAPLYWRGDSGNGRGLSYEIAAEIFLRTGCVITIEPLSSPRALSDMSQWRLDFYVLSSPRPDWEKVANYDVVYRVHRIFVVSKKHYLKNKSIQDYLRDKNLKIAGAIGSNMFLTKEERNLLNAQGRVIDLASPDQALQLLKEGRVQGTFWSPAILKHVLEQTKLRPEVELVHDSKNITPIGIYSSKRRVSSADRIRVQQAIKEMLADGGMKAILSKYFDPEDTEEFAKH